MVGEVEFSGSGREDDMQRATEYAAFLNLSPRNRTPRVHHASPGPDRWKERSRTLPGIAAAMAEQWGTL